MTHYCVGRHKEKYGMLIGPQSVGFCLNYWVIINKLLGKLLLLSITRIAYNRHQIILFAQRLLIIRKVMTLSKCEISYWVFINVLPVAVIATIVVKITFLFSPRHTMCQLYLLIFGSIIQQILINMNNFLY